MSKSNVSLSFGLLYILTRLCQIRTIESGDGDLVINSTTPMRDSNNDSSLVEEDIPGIFIINNSGGFNQIGGTSFAAGVSNGPGNGNSGGGTLGEMNINNNFGTGFSIGGGDVKWNLNCDYPGHNIGRIESTGEECGGICIANLQCTHFSRPEDGFCYMKKALLTTSHTVTHGGMCGFVPWRTEYLDGRKNWNGGEVDVKWLRNCDFPGHDIERKEVSREECGNACKANPECTHFRHPDDNNYCYLKKAPSTTFRTPINGGVCGIIPWRL